MHIHTGYSTIGPLVESRIDFYDIKIMAKKKGLGGVAITDHNTIKGSLKFEAYTKRNNLKLNAIRKNETRVFGRLLSPTRF